MFSIERFGGGTQYWYIFKLNNQVPFGVIWNTGEGRELRGCTLWRSKRIPIESSSSYRQEYPKGFVKVIIKPQNRDNESSWKENSFCKIGFSLSKTSLNTCCRIHLSHIASRAPSPSLFREVESCMRLPQVCLPEHRQWPFWKIQGLHRPRVIYRSGAR